MDWYHKNKPFAWLYEFFKNAVVVKAAEPSKWAVSIWPLLRDWYDYFQEFTKCQTESVFMNLRTHWIDMDLRTQWFMYYTICFLERDASEIHKTFHILQLEFLTKSTDSVERYLIYLESTFFVFFLFEIFVRSAKEEKTGLIWATDGYAWGCAHTHHANTKWLRSYGLWGYLISKGVISWWAHHRGMLQPYEYEISFEYTMKRQSYYNMIEHTSYHNYI